MVGPRACVGFIVEARLIAAVRNGRGPRNKLNDLITNQMAWRLAELDFGRWLWEAVALGWVFLIPEHRGRGLPLARCIMMIVIGVFSSTLYPCR